MKQFKIKASFRMLALFIGLILSVGAFAQTTLQGHVKDASGEPVIGATVRVDGQQNGVITDFDGNFKIMAKPGAAISVSYVGYKTKQATAQNGIVITLEEDAETLGEVVVIGYGVAKKSDLTGSVTALKPDSKNKGVVVNAQDMLQGKVAGVNIISGDGTPGGGAQIRIRGGSSLNASNDPLIVIDGLAMDNDGVKGLANLLSVVNPQDIESFNVLKDASATAIYGSRGSNGVIIITTKKGRKGQDLKVSYSGSVTISTKKETVDVLDGDQYRALITDMYGVGSEIYNAMGTANTDWQDLIYRTAVSQDHNLTLSGDVAGIPFRVSAGYTNQEGILKTSDFKRATAAINLNPSFFDDHLTLNLNAKGMYARSQYADGGAVSAAVQMDPTQDPYAFTSQYHKDMFGSDDVMNTALANLGGYFGWVKPAAYGDATWPYEVNTISGVPKNPLAMLELQDDVAHSRSFIGSADIDYKLHGFEDLRLHLTLGIDISKGKQNKSIVPQSPNAQYYGSYGYDQIVKRNTMLNAYIQYYKDFNKNHHFDIMAGYEWQRFWRSSHSDAVGYYPSTFPDASLANTERPHTPYSYKTESYLVSFFGRMNYILNERYYLTATLRNDGTSRFKDHWALFPSVALAWKINKESFLKDAEWLSDLKLRLGYGITGQQAADAIDNYNWIPTYSVSTGTNGFYPVLGNGTLYRPDNYTPDLKWEQTTTYNVGLDLGFFNQRLTMSADFYHRVTKDLLNYAPLAAMAGYRNQAWQNIGELENTGFELAIGWKAIQTKDWYWTLDYNLTYNKNEITNLTGVSDNGAPVPNTGTSVGGGSGAGYLQYYQVGQPANSFWVYQQVYDQDGKPIENCVVDRNADGKITDDDRYFYKSPVAPITMGLSSRLEYKNWDLGFSLRASFGNYVHDGVTRGFQNMADSEVWSNSNKYFSNRPISAVEAGFKTWEIQSQLSDYYIKNASFLKCDNITLGYSFANLFKSDNWQGLNGRVYATASNVFTITDYDGIDPEIASGIDNNLYPRPFSFIVGLNLNF